MLEKEEKEILDHVLAWARKDSMTIIIMILVLAACGWTLYHTGEIQESCNEHWIEQFKSLDCTERRFNDSIGNLNISFNIEKYGMEGGT